MKRVAVGMVRSDIGIRQCSPSCGVVLPLVLLWVALSTLMSLASVQGSVLQKKLEGQQRQTQAVRYQLESAVDQVMRHLASGTTAPWWGGLPIQATSGRTEGVDWWIDTSASQLHPDPTQTQTIRLQAVWWQSGMPVVRRQLRVQVRHHSGQAPAHLRLGLLSGGMLHWSVFARINGHVHSNSTWEGPPEDPRNELTGRLTLSSLAPVNWSGPVGSQTEWLTGVPTVSWGSVWAAAEQELTFQGLLELNDCRPPSDLGGRVYRCDGPFVLEAPVYRHGVLRSTADVRTAARLEGVTVITASSFVHQGAERLGTSGAPVQIVAGQSIRCEAAAGWVFEGVMSSGQDLQIGGGSASEPLVIGTLLSGGEMWLPAGLSFMQQTAYADRWWGGVPGWQITAWQFE